MGNIDSGEHMGLVCSSLSVWVLWATGNIDRGDIWDWYVLV